MNSITDRELNRRIIAASRLIGSFYGDDAPQSDAPIFNDDALRAVAGHASESCGRLVRTTEDGTRIIHL